jgi:transcriptional regulator with XRE-family HTH domain
MEKRINELMEHFGLSSAQFADKIGVQRSSISHILSGRNKPSFDFLQKIMTVFTTIDANWLLNGTGSIERKVERTSDSIVEQDLFSQQLIPKELIKNSIENTPEPRQITINNQSVTSNKIIGNSNKNDQVTNVNSIKQIIFIYENNTFELIDKK